MTEVCSVQISCNSTMWFGKRNCTAVRQLLAGFPKPCSSALNSNFFFPLLLSFNLADHSCPASHRKDSISRTLHQLLCLPLHTWWKALMPTNDSEWCPPNTHFGLAVPTSLLCDKHNTYLILPNTSASGTTDTKNFAFATQNWSSRLVFEWTIQKCGSFISHTKANSTVRK